jgi:uncharacterized protein GlcG (DUF336 family)
MSAASCAIARWRSSPSSSAGARSRPASGVRVELGGNQRGAAALPAAVTAVRTAAGATLVAALGAATAYGSLTLTRFRGFSQFGAIGATGMIAAWLATLVVLPALWAVFDRGPARRRFRWVFAARRLGWFGRRPGWLLASGGVLAALALARLSRALYRRRCDRGECRCTVRLMSQPPNPQAPGYGTSINLETARKVARAALAEGARNGWTVAVAVVDPAGELVYFERMDDTQIASAQVCQDKARTAARFKRPSKAFEEALAGGRLAVLGLGATPLEGGIPLAVDGKIIGAIGVSGVTSQQDGVCAQAGVDALAR